MLGTAFHLDRNLYWITSSYFRIAHINFPSLYFLNASCVGTRFPFNKMTVISFTDCVKCVALWSVDVCAMLPGCHEPLWRLVWNNGKLLTQARLFNVTRRLDHCDVIASLALRAEQSWHPNGNPLGTKARWHIWIESMDTKPNPAGQLMP